MKKATLLVTSVNPEESVTFDAIWKGTSLRNGGKVVGQETPFKIDVPAEAFQGLFRQTDGSGRVERTIGISGEEGEREVVERRSRCVSGNDHGERWGSHGDGYVRKVAHNPPMQRTKGWTGW